MTEISVDKGRRIRVYDNVLDLQVRNEIYTFARKSAFTIGWEDNGAIEPSQHKFLHATYSSEDITRLGIMFYLAKTPVFRELDGLNLSRAIMNLSTPSDVLQTHTHSAAKVLLYYVNLDWKNSWYGETLFFDESLGKIEFASPYTPGRIIVFDGSIPHTIRPQSHEAPFYRFTLSLFFDAQ